MEGRGLRPVLALSQKTGNRLPGLNTMRAWESQPGVGGHGETEVCTVRWLELGTLC